MLEYLLKNGSELCVQLTRHEIVFKLEDLETFEYVSTEGRDQGVNVRLRYESYCGGKGVSCGWKHPVDLSLLGLSVSMSDNRCPCYCTVAHAFSALDCHHSEIRSSLSKSRETTYSVSQWG